LDDPAAKEDPEQPLPQPAAEEDPINASGHYHFKRFDRAPAAADSHAAGEPDLNDVTQALQQPGLPGDAPSAERPPRPALSITIQSWATPVVGLVMLVFGLLGGYFLRPLIAPETEETSTSTQSQGTDTQTQSSPEDRDALMAAVVPSVRHFFGDPDAPITLIEFSDFQ
jgi:hypothetical protein